MLRKLTRRDMIKSSVAARCLANIHSPVGRTARRRGRGADSVPGCSTGRQTSNPLAGPHRLAHKSRRSLCGQSLQHSCVEGPRTCARNLGLCSKAAPLTLADIKARKRKTITATLECGGNGLGPGFMGAIGNMRWTGTPLADLLADCGPLKRAIEVVFFGRTSAPKKFAKMNIRRTSRAACTSVMRVVTISSSATS